MTIHAKESGLEIGASDMRNEYEPFQDNGQWWYWQVDDTLADAFQDPSAPVFSL